MAWSTKLTCVASDLVNTGESTLEFVVNPDGYDEEDGLVEINGLLFKVEQLIDVLDVIKYLAK